MTLNDFLLHVFVRVDDLYRQLVRTPLRSREPRRTAVTDPEVITVEVVDEFLGLDHDKGLLAHFRRYHAAEFPALARIHRTTFARQAANLYAVTKQLHAHLAERLAAWDNLFIVDRLPIPRPPSAGQVLTPVYRGCGLRVQPCQPEHHVRVPIPRPHPPRPGRRRLRPSPGQRVRPGPWWIRSIRPGRRSWRPQLRPEKAAAELADKVVKFVAPFRTKSKDPNPGRSRRISRFRWIIETAFGQLAGRLHIARTCGT